MAATLRSNTAGRKANSIGCRRWRLIWFDRQVAVIAATSTPAALAAKAATTTIPIVFEMASDPIRLGLVAGLSRPGGNVTGVTNAHVEIAPKRLQLLHELVPTVSVIALLVNPANSTVAATYTKEVQAAARTLGLELHVLNASTERDFDGVFAKLIQLRVGGLVIGPDPFFSSRSEQLAALASATRCQRSTKIANLPWPEVCCATEGTLPSHIA